MDKNNLINEINQVIAHYKRLAKKEQYLKKWEANLEDREQTLKRSYKEILKIKNG